MNKFYFARKIRSMYSDMMSKYGSTKINNIMTPLADVLVQRQGDISLL